MELANTSLQQLDCDVSLLSLSRFRFGLWRSKSYRRELVHFLLLLLIFLLCLASAVARTGRRSWSPLHLLLRRLLNPLEAEPGVNTTLAAFLPVLLKLLKTCISLNKNKLSDRMIGKSPLSWLCVLHQQSPFPFSSWRHVRSCLHFVDVFVLIKLVLLIKSVFSVCLNVISHLDLQTASL